MPSTTILAAMRDPKLFGRWFSAKNWRGVDTWRTWRAFLAALFSLPLDAEAYELYRKFTERADAPLQQAGEAWLVCGRRSGKSRIAALIAVFLAAFRDYSKVLAPGEIGTVMVIAADKKQARVLIQYIFAFFDEIAILSSMVSHRTKESITLVNRIRIEIHTASFRSVRGYTVVAAVLDEIAFFATGDSAEPDFEIVNALRPAMATVPNALLLGISSPYARRGVLWQVFRDCFGKPAAPALVWRAPTREMNSTVSAVTIAAAYLRDSASASAEYGAEFRSDIESFLSTDVIEQRVVRNRIELPPIKAGGYYAFCDPSGGVSDSMVLAIAHAENKVAILDVIREIRAPFVPEAATREFCDLLRKYHVGEVVGDRYSAEWCAQTFQKFGIQYRASEKSRSEIYLEFLPAVMSSSVELLDNARLKNQLASLERVTGRQRDVIDHPPGGHDDVSNAVAGCLVLVCADSGVFGLLEFDAREAALLEDRQAHAQAVLRLRQEAENRTSNPFSLASQQTSGDHLAGPACSQCGGATVEIFLHNYRCVQCGAVFQQSPDTQYVSNRIDLAEGRVVDSKIFGKLGRG